jgi:ATP-dependent DNA helicase RecQ
VGDLRPQLRELFGFDEFRHGQESVVRAAVEGRDTLALMPTGSGKSLTYQLAAMLRTEPTLVLSPLIALMKDQVDKLPPAVAATATFVNSSLDASETSERLQGVATGRTRLLYAAPERLRSAAFVDTLKSIGVGLVVIDEVHCVSMWGHDFRPDYLFIRHALDVLGAPTVLGMTATATPATAGEIAGALGRPLDVVRTSVARPNLRYDVASVSGPEERLRTVLEHLQRLDGGSAIVYARSRRSCETLARALRGHGLAVEHYHAGLEPGERSRIQDDFVGGRILGVVATTAFGMGIDKPDVRLVCLVNYPDSLESYVQMVGRAGRDGEPSDTLLLASTADATAVRRFAVADIPTADDLRRVYRACRDAGGSIEPETLAAAAGSDHDPRVLVGMLEQAGLVRRGYDHGRALQVELLRPHGLVDVDGLLARYADAAEARVDRIVRFAESGVCRHRQVAEHFGETLREPCGACDVCAPRPGLRGETSPTRPLPDDIGAAIVAAVASLRWPLGRRSLVAMLRGSVSAPRTARESPSYGLLEGASDADVKRWVLSLQHADALREIETDGYRVLIAVPGAALPPLDGLPLSDAAVDGALATRLRAWRLDRSRDDGVPAFVVFSDATLRELASRQPRTPRELAGVKGFGPIKVERYGDDLLEVIAGTPASDAA